MPRLKCTYREFVEIIEAHGFVPLRQGPTSHQRYRAVRNGVVYYVVVAAHNWNGEIPVGVLQSMIKQSGLPKKLFRK